MKASAPFACHPQHSCATATCYKACNNNTTGAAHKVTECYLLPLCPKPLLGRCSGVWLPTASLTHSPGAAMVIREDWSCLYSLLSTHRARGSLKREITYRHISRKHSQRRTCCVCINIYVCIVCQQTLIVAPGAMPPAGLQGTPHPRHTRPHCNTSTSASTLLLCAGLM